MATTIKHGTIAFEKVDEDDLYVNISQAASIQKKIDKNYENIVSAWKKIETSFTNLEGASTGKVKQMLNQAATASKKRKNAASKRKSDLDTGIKKDVQSFAKAVLDIDWMDNFIKRLSS